VCAFSNWISCCSKCVDCFRFLLLLYLIYSERDKLYSKLLVLPGLAALPTKRNINWHFWMVCSVSLVFVNAGWMGGSWILCKDVDWIAFGSASCLWGQHLLILFSKQKNLTKTNICGVKSFSEDISLVPKRCNPIWGVGVLWMKDVYFGLRAFFCLCVWKTGSFWMGSCPSLWRYWCVVSFNANQPWLSVLGVFISSISLESLSLTWVLRTS
jgi:hypothetical protein